MASAQLVLVSSDGVEIPVGKLRQSCDLRKWRFLTLWPTDREVAERSVLIKNMVEDLGEAATAEPIPIPNVRFAPFHLRQLLLTCYRSTNLS